MPNEQEQFLKEFENQENENPFDFLDQKPSEDVTPAETTQTTTEEDEQKLRNRRERRLAAKWQAERESSIALAARLEAITESQQSRQNESSDYLKSIERIYGTDTPEAREATELLKQSFNEVKEIAKREAFEALEERTRRQEEAVTQAEGMLDEMLEELEDEYSVDLTTSQSKTTRTGFLKLLEKMSPKDSDGNILQYADHHAVWEIYQEKSKKPADNTAKDLSSRSMANGAGEAQTNLASDVNERYLKEHGII